MVVDPVSSRATQFSNGVNLVHATSPRIRYRHARVFVAKQFRHRRSSQKRNILSSVDCSNRLSTQIPQTLEHCERNVFPSTHSFLSFPFHRATSYFFLTSRREERIADTLSLEGNRAWRRSRTEILNPLKAVRSSCRGNSRIRDLETRFDEVEILSRSLFLGYRFSAIFARI